jgi:hypothetical protein
MLLSYCSLFVPLDYYSSGMQGLRVEQGVLDELLWYEKDREPFYVWELCDACAEQWESSITYKTKQLTLKKQVVKNKKMHVYAGQKWTL